MSKKKQYLTQNVRCPNWTCSGELYIVDGDKSEDGWKMPNIRCDDCHTVWTNSLVPKKDDSK